MITPSIITYTVSDDDLGFSVQVDSKEAADKIQSNLIRTKELITVLEKYYKLKEEKKNLTNFQKEIKEYWWVNNDGIFNGKKRYYYKREEDWSGHRSPSVDEGIIETPLTDFIEELRNIIGNIKETINELCYIVPTRRIFAYLPQAVFNTVKEEHINAEYDLDIVLNYCNKYNIDLGNV